MNGRYIGIGLKKAISADLYNIHQKCLIKDYQNKDRLSVCSYSYYSENLNWAAQKPSTGPHAGRGLDIAALKLFIWEYQGTILVGDNWSLQAVNDFMSLSSPLPRLNHTLISCSICSEQKRFVRAAESSSQQKYRSWQKTFQGIVATSPVVLRWLCDSPRTGCAWRTPYIHRVFHNCWNKSIRHKSRILNDTTMMITFIERWKDNIL